MHNITLLPGGKFGYENWHPDSQSYTQEYYTPETFDDLARFLWDCVELHPEFTLGDLFRLIDVEGIEALEVFLQESVVAFIEEAKRPASQEKSHIEFLEVSLFGNAEVEGGHIIYSDFGGEGPPEDDTLWLYAEEIPEKISYSVSMTPVNEMRDIPLRFNKQLRFERGNVREHRNLGIWEYETYTSIRLVELLKAIFSDISFYGEPGDRNETRNILIGEVEDIRNEIEEGTRQCKSFENVKRKKRRVQEED